MAFLKAAIGGAAGAAAYTAYRDSDTILSSKDLATGLFDYWQKRGQSSLTEVSRLQKNVDDLQHALLKTLHDRQQPTVIVAGNGGKSGANTAAGVVLVVGGVALYLRYVKGWKLTDLMYVTRSSLSSLSESMKQGIDKMRAQFEERAADLLERMSLLGTKQEEMLEAQGQLGSEIAAVGGQVSAVSEQVGFSNHAILLLCGALSEMAKRVGISNGKYVKELEHLSRTVATTGLPAGVVGAGAALPAGMAIDPFHAPAAMLVQQSPSLPGLPAAVPAAAAAAAPAVNPAVFTSGLSSTADGSMRATGSSGGAAAAGGVRWFSEVGSTSSGNSDPWQTRQTSKPVW